MNAPPALFGGGGSPHIALEDPLAMYLTDEEVERASTIKAAVEMDDGINNLKDLEYVQYALTHAVAPENTLPTVLEHISRMQAFRETYKIQDTADEGTACIDAMSSQHPGLFLSMLYLPHSGNCLSINDIAAYFPSCIQSLEQHEIFLKGSYYRFQCMSPTFLAMRQGMSNVFECEGASFENYDSRFHEQLFAELYLSYPKRHKEMYFVNSPTIINIAFGLWKRFMTQNMKDTFRLGHIIPGMEGRRLDEIFNVPTAEIGRQNMVAAARQLLFLKYHNQATFQLPQEPLLLDSGNLE